MKNVADIYPLTPTQAGILYHTLKAANNELYFQQISCTVRADLDVDLFKQAWDRIVDRHPALRTVFLWEEVDEPLQIVRQTVSVPWERHDWRGRDRSKQAGELKALRESYRRSGFDLARAPILKMALVRLTDDSYHFIWNFHHLLADGWSAYQAFSEAFSLYQAMKRGEAAAPAPVRPFRDYMAWLKKQDLSRAERYWRQKLANFRHPTPLQVDRPAPTTAIAHGEKSLVLNASTSAALKEVAQQQRLTLNSFVLGAWALLLRRYSGQRDVVFGTTLSGRPADLHGVEHMVGMFINTLPLRVQVNDNARLLPWLQQIQRQLLEVQQVEYSPLAQVQRWSDLPPGEALFDSIIVFENYASEELDYGSLQIVDLHYREQSNYPLAILVVPGEQMRLLAIYNQHRFDEETIERLLGHLQTLLAAMAADPKQKLVALPLLSAAERQQLLVEWRGPHLLSESAVWLHDQITASAHKWPDRTAVAAEDGSLTYGELNRRANQLAHRLQQFGATPGTPIGLYVDRSAAMVAGILGILKAGCAYVPLDPSYPAKRVAFVLEETAAPVIITQPHLTSQIGSTEAVCLVLDNDWSQLAGEAIDEPQVNLDGANLAYIIYTSGSTGKPKGVMVSHANLFNSTAARFHYYAEPAQRYLLLSSFAFDSSVAGIFWALAQGGELHIPSANQVQDVDALNALVARQQITHTLALPSLYAAMLATADPGQLATLQAVIVAGEACPPQLGREHFSRLPNTNLYNEYGPTEGTVWSKVFALQEGHTGAVPIGRPAANMQAYICDSSLQPVPIGVPGELYIAGAGITRGYWQRPGLTAGRFLPNPFGEGRLYRSGDLARYRSDGNIEFLGRADHQVKIRGYRIELGEIEAALQQHPLVHEAAAVVHTPGPQPEPPSAAEMAGLLANLAPETAEKIWLQAQEETERSQP